MRVGLLAATWKSSKGTVTPDSDGYIVLADALATRGEFSHTPFQWNPDELSPEIFRTPGYPFFLMTAQAGKGVHALLQILIDTTLVGLTFLLGTSLVSRRVGLVGSAIQAVTPVAVAASCRVLSDSVYAFVLTLAVLLMVRHFRFGRWRSLLAAAFVLGLSCYVRPVGLAMAAVFVAVLLFRPKRFRRAGVFASIVLACIAPWVVRNAVTADYWGFSSFAGDSMYEFSAPKTLAAAEGIGEMEARDRMDDRLWESRWKEEMMTAGDWARSRRRIALRVILDHPDTYAWIHLKGVAAFWLPGATDVLEVAGVTVGQRGTLAVLHERGLLAATRHYFGDSTWAWTLGIALGLITLLTYLGVAVCVVRRLRPGMSAAAWLVLLIAGVSLLLGGPASTPRFRVPVAPLLSIAAAAGLIAIWQRLRKRQDEITEESA